MVDGESNIYCVDELHTLRDAEQVYLASLSHGCRSGSSAMKTFKATDARPSLMVSLCSSS